MPAKEKVRSALAAIAGQTLGNCVDTVTEVFVPQRAPATMRVRNYDVTDALAPVLDADKEPSAVAKIGERKEDFQARRRCCVALARVPSRNRCRAHRRQHSGCPDPRSSSCCDQGSVDRPCLRRRSWCFFGLALCKTILKWCQDGSQHPRFSEADLLSIPVPDAVRKASRRIAAIVNDGFAAREQSRRLLQAATDGVEVAIERGEAVALRAIDGNREIG